MDEKPTTSLNWRRPTGAPRKVSYIIHCGLPGSFASSIFSSMIPVMRRYMIPRLDAPMAQHVVDEPEVAYVRHRAWATILPSAGFDHVGQFGPDQYGLELPAMGIERIHRPPASL